MTQSVPRVTVYSDYVCPFCYLGRVSLDEYLRTRDRDVDLVWHPFDLRAGQRGPDDEIDESVDDGKGEAYYDRVRENVDRLRESYGADEMLGIDDVPDVDSFDAQVASLYVAEARPDRWLDFDEAVFEALWVDGRDVGDVDVLADLAAAVGLAPDDVRAAVADEAWRDRLREAFDEASEAGITGVPTFVHGEYAARGAVPPEQFERLFDADGTEKS